jgi:hypothetical protein
MNWFPGDSDRRVKHRNRGGKDEEGEEASRSPSEELDMVDMADQGRLLMWATGKSDEE